MASCGRAADGPVKQLLAGCWASGGASAVSDSRGGLSGSNFGGKGRNRRPQKWNGRSWLRLTIVLILATGILALRSSVALAGGPAPPSLSWSYGSGSEAYIFPGDAGMGNETANDDYCLTNPANVTITVLNSTEQVIKTVQQGVSEPGGPCYYGSNSSLSWDGTNGQGTVVPSGQYTIHVDAVNSDGEATLDTVVDVATPGPPGSLTTPSNGATIQGVTGFVFTPVSSFEASYPISEVDVNCIGTASAASPDGTWQASGDTSQCGNGSTSLDDTVYFTDPLGNAQSWTDPNPPSVTIANLPSLSWSYGAGSESYIFPGDAGMANETANDDYCLTNEANVTVTVLNSSNQVVNTLQQDVDNPGGTCYYGSNSSLSWDGTNGQGTVVPSGQYTIHVDAVNSDGEATLDTVVDVATGSPGQLTTPATDGTLSGLAQFAFTPDNSFLPGSAITEVDMCLSTGGCVASYNSSPDGTWRTTELTGDLPQGPATLTTTVYFSDPVGSAQEWTDTGRPVDVNTTAVPLQASLTTAEGVAPLTTALSIAASDPNGLPLQYTVDFGDGTADATGTIDYPYDPISLDHTFATAGIDTVNVSVSDGSTGFAQQQVNATVLNPTLPIQLVPTPATGTAPLASTFTLSTSDVSGQPVSYDVAFGDGQATSGTITSPYSPVTISHTYTFPGTYSAGATVSDPSGTKGNAIAIVTASGAVALQPNAGESQTGVAGTPVTLDGSGSQPSGSITSYQWSFGDGSTGVGSVVTHTYSSAGTYTAQLTIKANGQQNTAQTQVTIVAPPAPTKGLKVAVNDGSSPLAGASVAVITPDGTRYSGTTDGQGDAVISGLPDGSYTVYAYQPGYLPNTGTVTQVNNAGSVTISLQSGSVAQTSATSTAMTEQEIVAAGIDPNDPANQNVYQFAIHLAFVAGPTSQPVEVCGDLTGSGIVDQVVTEAGCGGIGGGGGGGGGWGLGGGGGGSSSCDDLCFSVGPYQVIGQPTQVQGEPAIMWMVIPGQAQWLKEFFDVKMVVSNLAPSGFTFDSGSISLGDLPSGLSLAPTADPQTVNQPVGDIPAGGSATAEWILRGDSEGFYTVTGNYNGTLDPIDAPLSLPISTATGAIHVWGGSAIHMIVDTDDQATSGDPYLIRVGLEDVADIPVYNADVELLTQGRLNYIYQPQQQLTYATDAIQPDATFWTNYYRLVPEITGNLDLSQSFVSQTGGNVEVASTIESHPATPPDEVPTLSATTVANGLQLTWEAPSVSGITGYEVFYTPTQDTPFSNTPVATLPATTLSTVLSQGEAGYYAVSAVVGGQATMYNALAEAERGAPGPTISASPASGVGKTKVVLSGANFNANQKVSIYIDSTAGKSVAKSNVGSQGTFSVSFTVKGLTNGLHSFEAVAADGQTGSSFFTEGITNSYVALGDSFSAGEGNPGKEPTPWVDQGGIPTTVDNGCDRSPVAYPMLTDKWLSKDKSLPPMSFNFLACSGATTEDLWNSGASAAGLKGANGTEPQQLLDTGDLAEARVVTVTIGGNDLNFADILANCIDVVLHPTCSTSSNDGWIADLGQNITTLGPILKSTYQQIEDESPNAALYVVAYPNIFPTTAGSACFGNTGILTGGMNYLASYQDQLTSVIQAAASQAGAHFINPNDSNPSDPGSVPASHSFVGHDICSHSSWFNNLNLNDQQYSFHPNKKGQAALAADVEAAIAANATPSS